MSHYRFYFLDGRNRIIGVTEGAFGSDATALEHAQTLLASHNGIEVWTGTRWVDNLMKRSALAAA